MRLLRIKFLLLLILISSVLRGQDSNRYIGFGMNLPPLIGKTLAISTELTSHRNYSFTVGVGAMTNCTLPRQYRHPVGEGTYNHSNSGVYTSIGIRFTPQKKINSTHFFIGGKLLGGYFKQSAEFRVPFENWFKDNQIPEDFYFIEDRVYSEGFFVGYAIESGINIKLTGHFHTEIGLQYGNHIFTTKKQVSSISSILPGLGSINIVGILKFLLQRKVV